VRAVTQATKEIEARISDDVWARQRKWDVKREAIFEILKAVATLQYSLGRVGGAYAAWNELKESSSPIERAKGELSKQDEVKRHGKHIDAFLRYKLLAVTVCGGQFVRQLDQVETRSVAIAHTIFREKQWADAALMQPEITKLIAIARSELGID